MGFLVTIAALAALQGCWPRTCADIGDGDERDACYVKAVLDAAEKDQLEAAVYAIERIESPMVRSYATDKLIAAAPTGLTLPRAEQLCRALSGSHGESCMKSWTRPHLWTRE